MITETRLKIERKKRYNTVDEREAAIRANKRRSKAKVKLRKSIPNSSHESVFSNLVYRQQQFDCIKGLNFTHECTLRFNNFTMIEDAEFKVRYFRELLQKLNIIYNVINCLEFGADKNIHVHLALNFTEQFLKKYNSNEKIKTYLYELWNFNGRNGTVWVDAFYDDRHKVKYLKYMLKQLFPCSTNLIRQKQIEAFYVQSYVDVCSFPVALVKTKDVFIYSHILTVIQEVKKMKSLRDYFDRHKQKILSAALTALLLLIT
ncbi:hypothetical protein [Pedobacter cryotolerans]|uniref:Uncharacterized protein n=1 Tax=Pedobacter cryotolerans TaxID=2571270 RepID=A0A4U1BVI4_9SPHI|nr:hypothetical protein [Pedobacter cryotolerans]TKB96531.1 hypothetical protein FA045_17880 [Pedobacter cryotolerans]